VRDLDVLRVTIERAARAAAGLNPIGDRSTMAAARSAEMEALIARLPIETENLEPIQHPTTGVPFFMFDVSLWGDEATDPWA
jgi:hypothetical protein